MNILDIGGGFTGSEFQLKQVSGKKPNVKLNWKTQKAFKIAVVVCYLIFSHYRFTQEHLNNIAKQLITHNSDVGCQLKRSCGFSTISIVA